MSVLSETPAAAATVGVRVAATAVTCDAATSHTGFMKKAEELEWTRSEGLNCSPLLSRLWLCLLASEGETGGTPAENGHSD